MNRISQILAVFVLAQNPAWAQILRYSPNTWVQIGDEVAGQTDLINDAQANTVTVIDNPLSIPVSVDLTALDSAPDGSWVFAIDTSVELGGVLIMPADIGKLSGSTYTLAFDGSANAVPSGARLDALTMEGNDYIMSFDITVDFGSFVASDEDLVRFDGVNLSLELDLSAEGLPENLDLEAAHRRDDGTYLLSFSEHSEAGGISFADEDILGLDPSDSTWSMVFDGSALHAELGSVSINALSTVEDELFKDGFEDLIALLSRKYSGPIR